MKRIELTVLTLVIAAFFAACGAPADNKPAANNANAANTAAKPTAAAPTKEALMTLEKAGWEAWKNRDSKWTEENASDKYVGFGSTGRLDKAAAIKSYTAQKCEVKSFSFSDDNMHMAGPDVAILTFKGAQDYTCDGKKGPANVWSASIYVREGDKWKNAFYAEAPVVDPKAPPAKPAASAKKEEAKPSETKSDAMTDALIALEKKAWDDWKTKNAKGLDEWAAKELVSLSGTEGWTDRAASLKRWNEDKCEIKSVSLTDPASVTFGSEYALLTFKSAVDGKCDGQAVTPEWDATVYAKEGGVWKAMFTMGTPAG